MLKINIIIAILLALGIVTNFSLGLFQPSIAASEYVTISYYEGVIIPATNEPGQITLAVQGERIEFELNSLPVSIWKTTSQPAFDAAGELILDRELNMPAVQSLPRWMDWESGVSTDLTNAENLGSDLKVITNGTNSVIFLKL